MGDTSVPATRSPDRAEEETAAPADTPIEVDVITPRLLVIVSRFHR